MRIRNSKRSQAHAASPSEANFNLHYFLLVLLCGAVIAAGFFFAARQHFMSMDYGFKNSKLKKQLEDLEAEKRRLMLAREVSLSPAEIRKASRTVALRREGNTQSVAVPLRAGIDAARPEAKPATVVPLVTATASVRPVGSVRTEHANPSQSGIATIIKDKREIEIAAVAKLR
jgi:hypothetical protein